MVALVDDEFADTDDNKGISISMLELSQFNLLPILIAAVWKEAPDDERDLVCSQFFHCNVKWIRLAFDGHQNRSVHADSRSRSDQLVPVDNCKPLICLPHLICKALVPNIRALSYLVM